MSVEDLCKFLKEIGIEDKYIKLFKSDKINGSELARYGEDELEDLGITKPRIRKKIIAHFEVLD